MHKPINCFKSKEDYLSEVTNPETNETYDIELEDFKDDSVDDYRTEKEKRDDMGDYLRDRSMDLQHELCEKDCGAR